MNKDKKLKHTQKLKLMKECPVCAHKYSSNEEFQVLEEEEQGQLLHITCAKCKHSVLAVVIANGFIISSIAVVTDLNKIDIQRLQQKGPLAEDDILDIHTLINYKTQKFIQSLM